MGRMGGRPDDHRSRGVRQRRVRLCRIRRAARLSRTTPTSRCCCAGWSTYPSPPRCGCRRPIPPRSAESWTPAPTRSSSRWSSRPNRRPPPSPPPAMRPQAVRSFGPLRASLGHDPATLEARVSVFAMVETARGLSALDEICAVPGLDGRLRRARGPRDLAGVAWPTRGRIRPSATRCHECDRRLGRGAGDRHPRRQRKRRKGHGANWASG